MFKINVNNEKWFILSSKNHSFKGQLILKANCEAEDSSKKRTNEFVFTSMRRLFVRFLEESLARNKTFRDYLTFSNTKKKSPLLNSVVYLCYPLTSGHTTSTMTV